MIRRFSAIIQLLLIGIVLAVNINAFAVNKTPASILVLGDSLSGAYGISTEQGWVALLQQHILGQGYEYQVINASVSGDTTRTGSSRIEAALQQHQPGIVIIALGGNDGLRGLAFTEIENSLADIIQRCQKNQAQVLLAGVRLPPNYGPVYTERFAALYQRLSERFGVPLVPRMLDQVAEYRELLQEDGIHPTTEAQPQIMKNVWAGLKPMLEKTGTSNE
jgi:acyl-CoA thioesterase-1